MKYLPILIDIRNQDVLVVGGDRVAARKARNAHRAGAKVTVIGALESDALAAAVASGDYRHVDERFEPGHLQGARLVFAATDDMDLAQQVSRAAREASIPVNVADKTALCSFIMPAMVDRDPIIVAVSSGSDAPILTRSLRARLETLLPAELGSLAAFVTEHRAAVSEALPDFDTRRRFWDSFMEGPVPELVSDGDLAAAEHSFTEALAAARTGNQTAADGGVTIIGCGPGDPDMLTFKALRHMQQADIILAASDVPEPILARARRDADVERSDFDPDVVAAWTGSGKAVARLGMGDFAASAQGMAEANQLAERGVRTLGVAGIAAQTDGTA